MQVGLGPGHTVLDGDLAALPPKGHSPQFWPISLVTKWLDGSRCHLVPRWASTQAIFCYMGIQLPPKGAQLLPQFSAHVYCGQTVAHLSYY